MTDRIGSLRHAWGLLAARAGQAQSLRVFAMTDEPRAFRAVLNPSGFRGLLVGVAEGERVLVPRALQPDVAAALVGEVAYFDAPGAGQRRFLHVWCRDHQADQAFEAFSALLWGRTESEDVSTALRQCSDEFRRLLLADGEPAPRSVVGLIGELLVLRRLVQRNPALISSWTGPSGARHDFRRGNAAIETKTTVRSEARGRLVRISDIDQLEPPENGTLHLYLVRLEQAMAGTLSVASLVEQIMSCLATSEATAFRQVLGDNESRGSTTTFELREEVAYRVRDGFPSLTKARLVGSKLDAGVSHVCYDLALEGAAAFEVPVMTAIESLAETSA